MKGECMRPLLFQWGRGKGSAHTQEIWNRYRYTTLYNNLSLIPTKKAVHAIQQTQTNKLRWLANKLPTMENNICISKYGGGARRLTWYHYHKDHSLQLQQPTLYD